MITVRVAKKLTEIERKNLIQHIRFDKKDLNLAVEIIEPPDKPLIDFDFEVLQVQPQTVESTIVKTPEVESVEVLDNKDSWIYGDNLVVMQNRLLNAITNLDLDERRLIMLLCSKVRKAIDIDESTRTFIVTAIEFDKEYAIGEKNVYKKLAEVADSLLEKAFWFYDLKADGISNRKGSSWVAECNYLKGKGKIEITLTSSVTEMLTVFDRSNPFTKYERHYIVNLGCYGLVLFELITSYLHLKGKKKAFSVDYLRKRFNSENKYKKITDFKIYVIDKAIQEVEKNTPLRITYTQNKVGKDVTELVFSYKDTKALNNKLKPTVFSTPEIKKYGWQIKDKHEVVSEFPQRIKTSAECQEEIEKRMANPENYQEYLGFLKKFTDFNEKLHITNFRKKIQVLPSDISNEASD